jgi:hypothetical protein
MFHIAFIDGIGDYFLALILPGVAFAEVAFGTEPLGSAVSLFLPKAKIPV